VAIGKEGQNARLAARLTGWRVDIKSESQLFEEEQNPVEEEWAAGEWITDESGQMVWQPAEGGEAVSASDAGYGGDEEEKIDESVVPGEVEAEAAAAAAAEAPAEAVAEASAGVAGEEGDG
jgi:N utilization substance protein A